MIMDTIFDIGIVFSLRLYSHRASSFFRLLGLAMQICNSCAKHYDISSNMLKYEIIASKICFPFQSVHF